MSNGPFLRAFYRLNNLEVAAIRVQPETAALVLNGVTNAIVAGPATWPTRARVSGSRRGLGTFARGVYITFGPNPDGGFRPYSSMFLPWFNESTWEALPPDAEGTYQGNPVTLSGKVPEQIR